MTSVSPLATSFRGDWQLTVAVQGLAATVLFASGFVDVARAIRFGPVTGQALLTMIYFFAAMLLLAVTPVRGTPTPLKTLPLAVFWLWAAISLAWTHDFRSGAQNVLVIGTMLVILLASEAIVANEPVFALWLEKQLFRSELMALILYTGSVVCFGIGTNELISARSFGLFALFGVAHNLSRWRYGRRAGLAWAIAITLVIGASESRLALGIAVVLFPLSQFPTQRAIRAVKMFVVLVIVAGCSYATFSYSESFQQRFLSGDVSLKLGPILINGNGRTAFWRLTMQSFDESPLVGKGAGSAEALIDSVFDMGHPHNDYLRIAHDYGIVGIVIWVTAIGTLLFTLWRRWNRADRLASGTARLQLTALLSLVAFSLEMTVENALVYVFVTAPLGLIVGAAFGAPRSMLRQRVV